MEKFLNIWTIAIWRKTSRKTKTKVPETQTQPGDERSSLWQSPIPQEPNVPVLELPSSQDTRNATLETKDEDGDGNSEFLIFEFFELSCVFS